jgi:hypothetical protein
VQYTTRVSSRMRLRLFAEGAFFRNSSAALAGVDLFSLGISPEIEMSSTITLPIRLKVSGGTQKNGKFLGGCEFGVGVSALLQD